MKKTYIKPTLEVVNMAPCTLMAASEPAGTTSVVNGKRSFIDANDGLDDDESDAKASRPNLWED